MHRTMTAATVLGFVAWASCLALAQDGAAPASGTVTGTLVVDGKPIALHTASAISYPHPFDGTKKVFKVALSPAPVKIDRQSGRPFADAFDQAVTQGLTVDLDDAANCQFLLIRDPSLGDRRIAKAGSMPPVCAPGAITIAADRVTGTLMSSPDGGEEALSGHKVSYKLRFNAPLMK